MAKQVLDWQAKDFAVALTVGLQKGSVEFIWFYRLNNSLLIPNMGAN